MDVILANAVGLLLVAIIVAIAARRLRLPYTVGLVVAGVGLALAHVQTGLVLTHDFIYLIFLPPLLFEAALSIHWNQLRQDLVPVLVLSTLGVAVSALVVAGGMAYLLGWPMASAMVFGVLIAATDPVAVIAMFKDLGLTGRLRLLVESESLFNDGVAAVLFALALAWALAPGGEKLGFLPALLSLATIVGGGLGTGLIVGGGAILVAGRSPDHLVGAALTSVAAYGSFLLAEHFHFSGVLATVAAGLLMGNLAVLGEPPTDVFSSRERGFVLELWEIAAFTANSLIFLLIGLAVGNISFAGIGMKVPLIAVALVLLGRLLTVYPLSLLFARSRWAITIPDQHILWWGGLRGALALALALSLPSSLAYANEIKITAFAVVVFSVVFQGLTMPVLLRKLGRIPAKLA
ncbi:MAG: cation:proton antiporter [Alphaproteobacteria bacterium]|nr:cation:proton antiporter [Alphaproteobacteria bacterium]